MEGTILGLEALTSPLNFIGGVSLLAVFAGVVAFGYMAEEEKAGRKASGVCAFKRVEERIAQISDSATSGAATSATTWS